MRKQHVLAVTTKPLQAKHPKPKLVWPGYRELLNLDKQNTQKIQSDDENQNYLEKLLKKELEEKKQQEEQMKLQKLQEERDRKMEEKRKRLLQRLQRKRMIEDGFVDPDDPDNKHLAQEEPSQESVLEPVQSAPLPPDNQKVGQQPVKSKVVQHQPTMRLLSKSISLIHKRQCRSADKMKKPIPIQPYIVTGGMYLTQKKTLPSDYNKYIQRLKYKTVEPEMRFEEDTELTTRRPSTNKTHRLNPQRLEVLSKPKSASTSRLKQYAWTELQHKSKDQQKCDFNFVVRQHTRQNELRRRNTLQKRESMNANRAPPSEKMSISQLFLRKMFVSTKDQKMFRTDLAVNRRNRH